MSCQCVANVLECVVQDKEVAPLVARCKSLELSIVAILQVLCPDTV
jgi:hypothetical protein